MRVGTKRLVAAVVGGSGEVGVYREILVYLSAANGIGRFACSLKLLFGSLERRGEAPVFYGVGIAHAAHDDVDGVSRKQKTRRQRDGYAHQKKYAQVFSYIVLKLARKALR